MSEEIVNGKKKIISLILARPVLLLIITTLLVVAGLIGLGGIQWLCSACSDY